MSQEGSGPQHLNGGALCLDFVNTLGDWPPSTREGVRGYDELLRWAAQVGMLAGGTLRRRRRQAARRPRLARAALARALRLREALYRVFAARARGQAAAAADLAVLNEALRRALPHQQLAPGDEGFRWEWEPRGALELPLWPVARSAADLLVSPEASLVQECGSETCTWLFVDRSPGARRRWCDMKTCGNRAKARRFYQRRKVATPAGAPARAVSAAGRRAARS